MDHKPYETDTRSQLRSNQCQPQCSGLHSSPITFKGQSDQGLEKNQREDLRWIWGSCYLHGKQNRISRLLGYRPPPMVATDRISGPFSFMTASNQGLISFLHRQLWVFSIHTWQKSKLPTVTRITHWKSRAWLLQTIIWCPRLWLSPFLGNCFAQVLKEVKLLFT